MGKRGPCFHCGIQRTPLWRNGPPEKPVLCNACGSRYRIRGTLLNYTPKHLQSFPFNKKKKKKKKKKVKKQQRKTTLDSFLNNKNCRHQDNISSSVDICSASVGYESGSKPTSSKSTTISYTQGEGYLQEDGSQVVISDKMQESSWDLNVPSRKRSLAVSDNLSLIEKLQRDLYKIQSSRDQDPSNFLSQDQGDGVLLYNHNLNHHISPPEIGLGIMLLKSSTNPDRVG